MRVITQDIFDLSDPRENNALYRLANRLHINTKPEVIRNALLFKSGEPVSLRVIEETERLLRRNGYLYDVSIRPVAYRDGVADIEVRTRDTWSLDIGISASRAGGENTGRLALKEENLLGRGITLGFGYSSDVDRSGTTFEIGDNNLFGTRGVFFALSPLCLLGLTLALALQRCFTSFPLLLGPPRGLFRLSFPLQGEGCFLGFSFFLGFAFDLLLQQKGGLTSLAFFLSSLGCLTG